jgi:hypothetical protein
MSLLLLFRCFIFTFPSANGLSLSFFISHFSILLFRVRSLFQYSHKMSSEAKVFPLEGGQTVLTIQSV